MYGISNRLFFVWSGLEAQINRQTDLQILSSVTKTYNKHRKTAASRGFDIVEYFLKLPLPLLKYFSAAAEGKIVPR